MVSPSATERRVTSSLPVAEVESVPPVPPSPESAQPDTAARAATSSRRTIRAGMTARSRVPFLSLCVWKDTEINYRARHAPAMRADGIQPLTVSWVAAMIRYLMISMQPNTSGDLHPSAVEMRILCSICLLYTSDAADDLLCVDLGGRRIIKKKKTQT